MTYGSHMSAIMSVYPIRCQGPWLYCILLLYLLVNKSGAISSDGMVASGYFSFVIL
uniref:Uncharacterized protein n=1 Tax=Rhizophora mucronata TaxID=61149 RepID=A0A2P2LXX0_RHIMU